MIDTEEFLDDLETMLKTNLNTQIEALEARKAAAGKPIGLPTINENAWHLQSLDDRFVQYNTAVLYGVERVQPKGEGPFTALTLTFFVEIYSIDGRSDTLGIKRMLRYTQALKEVCEKYYAKNRLGATTKVETITPISFRLNQNGSEEVRVGGVSLTASFV